MFKRSTHHAQVIQFIHDNANNDTSLEWEGVKISNVGRTLQTFLPMLEQGQSFELYKLAFYHVKRIKDELRNV